MEFGNGLNVEEVAKLLNVHVNTVRNYIKRGTVKASKIQGQWVIPNEEFLRLKREQQLTPRMIIEGANLVLDQLGLYIREQEEKLKSWNGVASLKEVDKYNKLTTTYENVERVRDDWNLKVRVNFIGMDEFVDSAEKVSSYIRTQDEGDEGEES